MTVARMLRRLLLAPLRALQWVYAPQGRTRLGRGEVEEQAMAAGLGLDTTRWMQLDARERRRRDREGRIR